MGCCCSSARDEDSPKAGVPPATTRRTYGSGTGQTLGGGGVNSNSGVTASDAAAMAAMERANKATGSGASERDRKLLERRQKDDLIGKINAHYAQLGKDPPIGLGASTIDQLKKHLDYIKNDAAKTSKINAAAASMDVVRL